MSSKLAETALNLKQFLLRKEVLKVYRDILRTIRKVPDQSTRADLREWARSDFKNNKNHTDEAVIKSLLQHGRKSLNDLRTTLSLSK